MSGWAGSFDAICQRIAAQLGMLVPVDCLTVTTHDDVSILRVGPTRLWFVCDASGDRLRDFLGTFAAQDAVVTEIGHSRTVLRLSGPGARTVLNRGLPIDLDDSAFPESVFAQSIIHHIPALVHRLPSDDDTVFDIYVPREYAVSFWEWLTEAAAPLGGQILKRA
jgi:sarcosine oxidase subunit gamma